MRPQRLSDELGAGQARIDEDGVLVSGVLGHDVRRSRGSSGGLEGVPYGDTRGAGGGVVGGGDGGVAGGAGTNGGGVPGGAGGGGSADAKLVALDRISGGGPRQRC